MYFAEACDANCLEIRADAEAQADAVINKINLANGDKVEENGEYIEILESLISNTDMLL